MIDNATRWQVGKVEASDLSPKFMRWKCIGQAILGRSVASSSKLEVTRVVASAAVKFSLAWVGHYQAEVNGIFHLCRNRSTIPKKTYWSSESVRNDHLLNTSLPACGQRCHTCPFFMNTSRGEPFHDSSIIISQKKQYKLLPIPTK